VGAQPPAPVVLSEPRVTVKIPRPLYRKIQHVIEGSGFSSPTDFIVFVMRDLVGEADARADGKAKTEVSAEELESIKRKLKNLGYL
jgi:Arc/MetJ-type ribon-helix-helix transcriptional regulator